MGLCNCHKRSMQPTRTGMLTPPSVLQGRCKRSRVPAVPVAWCRGTEQYLYAHGLSLSLSIHARRGLSRPRCGAWALRMRA